MFTHAFVSLASPAAPPRDAAAALAPNADILPPVLPYHKLPVFGVGLPKSGSTSVLDFMRCGGFPDGHTSHFDCSDHKGTPPHFKGFCGLCAKANFRHGRPLLHNCGPDPPYEYDVWAELNYTPGVSRGGECFFPQVTALKELYQWAPNATWVLPMRPPENWVASVAKWGTMQADLTDCDLGEDLPVGKGNETSDLISFYNAHNKKVEAFVKEHPSLTFLKFNIEDEDGAAHHMSRQFNISDTCWGKANCKASCGELEEMLEIKETQRAMAQEIAEALGPRD